MAQVPSAGGRRDLCMKHIAGRILSAAEMATAVTAERVIPKEPWKTKILGGHKGSRTPGKTKGPTCQTDPMKKFFLTHPHAWKHAQYGEWCNKVRVWVYGAKAKVAAS